MCHNCPNSKNSWVSSSPCPVSDRDAFGAIFWLKSDPWTRLNLEHLGRRLVREILVDRQPNDSVPGDASGRSFPVDEDELLRGKSDRRGVFTSHNDSHEGIILLFPVCHRHRMEIEYGI